MTTQQKLTISCEFFPPRTEQGLEKLRKVRQKLEETLNPQFFSVTFGAGGSTQSKTLETVLDIKQSGAEAAPHLSCIASTEQNIRELLNQYKDNGINRIVALRGDKPSGWSGRLGKFAYANELVKFIRQETGDHFHLEVAAYPEFHPQAHSAKEDLDFFKQKVDAGANSAITQYFYNPNAYERFLEECAKRAITIPIMPGIMPISNFEQLSRFSDTCGAEIPRWLRWRLQDLQNDSEAMQDFGVEVVSKLAEQLIASGAPGLHFYTLNKADLILRIANNLNLIN